MQDTAVLIGVVVLCILSAIGAHSLGASPALAGCIPLAIFAVWGWMWTRYSR